MSGLMKLQEEAFRQQIGRTCDNARGNAHLAKAFVSYLCSINPMQTSNTVDGTSGTFWHHSAKISISRARGIGLIQLMELEFNLAFQRIRIILLDCIIMRYTYHCC